MLKIHTLIQTKRVEQGDKRGQKLVTYYQTPKWMNPRKNIRKINSVWYHLPVASLCPLLFFHWPPKFTYEKWYSHETASDSGIKAAIFHCWTVYTWDTFKFLFAMEEPFFFLFLALQKTYAALFAFCGSSLENFTKSPNFRIFFGLDENFLSPFYWVSVYQIMIYILYITNNIGKNVR